MMAGEFTVNFVVEEDKTQVFRRDVCSLWRIFRIQRNDLGEIPLLTGLLLKVVLYRASEVTRLCADMIVFVILKQPWSGLSIP